MPDQVNALRTVSLFSGVGGLCSLGLAAAGHHVVALCEIDAKARSVLRRDHPDTPIHDDVTTWEPNDELGRVDLVAGGSPCQDLSVAGRRGGLDGARSGLFWHQCRIADELAAPWVLWENVAGAFSSNDGADFAAVLWGLTGALPDVPDGGWRSCGVVVGPKRSAVWRLLDAQWFGVAQRRRRVFVVAGPRGLCGPEVLALSQSVSGHPRPSRTTGQEPAGTLGGGAGSRGWACDTDRMTFVPTRWVGGAQQGEFVTPDGITGSLAHSSATHLGHHEPKVMSFNWQGSAEQGADVQEEYTGSLGCTRHPAVMFSENQRAEVITHDVAHSLKVGGGKPGQGYPAVAFAMRGRDGSPEIELGEPEVYNSLRAGDGGSSRQNGLLTPDLALRRLTPRECERLMGWPDDHTRWADDGTEIADSHRYRMCGNGVVAPVAEWIGRRLLAAASASANPQASVD